MTDDSLLQGQIEYYRARSQEYDDWFMRRGRYDRGDEATKKWKDEVGEVRSVLSGIALDGKNVLELAPGTGLWTEQFAGRVDHLTAVDSSPEMIELNRLRLGSLQEKVTYVVEDLFQWQPPEEYDAVVFCFWISHIPERLFQDFLQSLRSMLAVGGSIFFVDSKREINSTATDHVLPDSGEELMTRRLDDGREFTIVKNFWDANELEEKFRDAGMEIRVAQTEQYFQYGTGIRVR